MTYSWASRACRSSQCSNLASSQPKQPRPQRSALHYNLLSASTSTAAKNDPRAWRHVRHITVHTSHACTCTCMCSLIASAVDVVA